MDTVCVLLPITSWYCWRPKLFPFNYCVTTFAEGTACQLRRILSKSDPATAVESILIEPLNYRGDAVVIDTTKPGSGEFNMLVTMAHDEPVPRQSLLITRRACTSHYIRTSLLCMIPG